MVSFSGKFSLSRCSKSGISPDAYNTFFSSEYLSIKGIQRALMNTISFALSGNCRFEFMLYSLYLSLNTSATISLEYKYIEQLFLAARYESTHFPIRSPIVYAPVRKSHTGRVRVIG